MHTQRKAPSHSLSCSPCRASGGVVGGTSSLTFGSGGSLTWTNGVMNGTGTLITQAGSVTTLTSLDFLGLGVPPGTPSLGELLAQGKANLDAWWITLST